MPELLVVSLMSPNARPAHAAAVAWLRERAGVDARLVEGPTWREQLAMLDAGEAQAAFVCGLPYVRRDTALEALAAPAQAGARYGGRPVYFSDVLVRADSPYSSLAGLRGSRLAYNEAGSLSGYEVLRARLAELGAPSGFFGAALESGSHLESLRMLAAGAADCAALDTTVLELAARDDPDLAGRVRAVAALGPSPAPPFAAARSLPGGLRRRLRDALAAMHEDPAGRAALRLGLVERMAPVVDADYDPIRRLARRAEGVALT